MERNPQFEDERIRIWRLGKKEHVGESDPTVLDLETEREELYESRVYSVDPAALAALTLAVATEHPDISPAQFVDAWALGANDASVRILAKQAKADGKITFILVGVFAGSRALLAREDLVDEIRFRAFVREFEEPVLGIGLLGLPTVIDAETWQRYSDRPE